METGEDRLTLLPDAIIDHILSFLTTKEVVRATCLLSKKWCHLWTTLSTLRFDVSMPEDEEFVDRALARRPLSTATTLTTFRLKCPAGWLDAGRRSANWLRYAAASQNLRKLHFHIGKDTDFGSLDLILACLHLEFLQLKARIISIPDLPNSFSFSKLRVLYIYRTTRIVGKSIGRLVLSHCPALEELHLVGRFDGFDICAAKLRKFSLRVLDFSSIRISCPLLEKFCFRSRQPRGHFQGQMPSLISLVLEVPFKSFALISQILTGANSMHNLSIDFLDQNIKPYPPHLKEKRWLPRVDKLTSLCLHSCFHDYYVEALICLLKNTPNLQKLKVRHKKCNCTNKKASWKSKKLKYSILGSLREVDLLSKHNIANKGEFVKFLFMNSKAWRGITLKI